MADVAVFVDTAVLGTLPPVCVKDGTPTLDHLTIDTEVAGGTGLGLAWLLILFGPLGWLGLLVIALLRRPPDHLTVRVPLCEHTYQNYRAARRMSRVWLVVAVGGAVLALVAYRTLHPLGAIAGVTLALCALAALVTSALEWHRATSATVSVELDASRRWVTLSRVHPGFVTAIERERRTWMQVPRP